MSVFHQSDPFWDRMVSILPTTHMIGGFNLAKIIPNRKSMEHLHKDCKIYVNHCEPLNHQISCHIVNHCQPSFINHHISQTWENPFKVPIFPMAKNSFLASWPRLTWQRGAKPKAGAAARGHVSRVRLGHLPKNWLVTVSNPGACKFRFGFSHLLQNGI